MKGKKVQVFEYLGSTVQSNGGVWKRDEEESACRVEWVEKSV